MAEPAEIQAAAPATVTDLPVPAEEKGRSLPRVRQEIEAKLREYKPSYQLRGPAPNLLNGRFLIKTDQPLEELSHNASKAFAITDPGGNPMPLYAAVCDTGLPYRHTSMEKLLNFEHPHLIRLVDHGTAFLPLFNEQRHVLVFERPQGKRLSTLLNEGLQLNEQSLHEQILAPISALLGALVEQGISHCYIHPDNIFLGDKVVLGECISEPAGYSQEFLYEPVERITAIPQGKGGGSHKVDVYAIGVLVVDVLFRLARLRTLSKDQVTGLLLQHGCYNVVAGHGEFSEYFHDLLRGSLGDDPVDRWAPSHLAQWMTGKRFNIIHPSAPRESSRPFTFEGKDYFNRKALAHAFVTQWKTACNTIRTSKLDRWLEQSIQEPDMAEMVVSAISATGGPTNKNQKRSNELLSRVLTVLDPSGPLRIEHLAFNIDAIGKMLSDSIYSKKVNDLNLLVDIIQNDLPQYWSSQQGGNITQEVQEALWKLQAIRPSFRNPGFGFGIERCLYDLNHDLPCYSSELKGLYITDNKTFMQALDALSAEKPFEFSLIDRHLAAFAASRANINRELNLGDIASCAPELANNQELKILQLFAKVQDKSGLTRLPGLSCYAALRVLSLLETVHSRNIRDNFANKIRSVAEQGRIQLVLDALLDYAALEKDRNGFAYARELYHRNQAEINKLRDKNELKRRVRDRGHRWASLLSIMILMIAVIMMVIDMV